MSIPQTYYTSSARGPRGTQGFQTVAATPGLPADTITALERLGSYVPPLSAPLQPTSEQIAQMPVSLVFSRLPNGTAVIGQSKYLGKDYTDRYGNFFSHFIVFTQPDTYVDWLLPICLWRSGVWQTTESTTTELAALSDVEPGSLAIEDLDAFLRAPGRLDQFDKLITAVEKGLGGGLRIILAADTDSIAFWIFAVTVCLPAHLAWSTTFTTYTKSPAQISTLIAGTTIDSDFGFSYFEIEHQYSVFDFVEGRFSRIDSSPFASMVTEAFRAGGVNAIARFADFAGKIAPQLPLAELSSAFGCYALLYGLPRHVSDVEICMWCAQYVPSLSRTGMLSKVLNEFSALPLDMPSIRAIHSLFNAAAHANLASEVEDSFLRILLKVVGTAELDWLRVLPLSIRGLRLPALPSLPPDQRDAPVLGLRKPLRLCAAIRVWDALGWLTGRDNELRDIGRTIIGVKISDPQVCHAVQTVIASSCGTQVMEGVAEHLQELAQDERNYPNIRNLITDLPTASLLKRIAAARRYAELAVFIVHDELSRQQEEPLALFRAALTTLEQHGRPLDSGDTALAFRLAWGNSHPNTRECQGIFETFSGPRRPLLASSRLPERIAESLVERRHSLLPDDYVHIDELLSADLLPVLGEHAVDLEALRFLRETESADPAKSVRFGLELASQLQEPLRTATVHNAAWFLVGIDHSQSHQAALVNALRDHGESAAAAYAEALAKLCSRPDARRIDRLGRIIRTWFRISTDGTTPPGAAHIEKVFVRVYQSLNKQQRSALKGEITKGGGAFVERWELLTEGNHAGQGFFSNLLRFFGDRR